MLIFIVGMRGMRYKTVLHINKGAIDIDSDEDQSEFSSKIQSKTSLLCLGHAGSQGQ
jgi:hypothetical protein